MVRAPGFEPGDNFLALGIAYLSVPPYPRKRITCVSTFHDVGLSYACAMQNQNGFSDLSCRCWILALVIMSKPLLAAVDPTTATLERSAIDEKFKWDLSKMYPNEQAWESHYKELDSMIGKFAAKAGKVGD